MTDWVIVKFLFLATERSQSRVAERSRSQRSQLLQQRFEH